MNIKSKKLVTLFLSLIVILISKKNKEKKLTVFLYGGIGDQIIIIDQLNILSKEYEIEVYLDEKFRFLDEFLTTKNIIFYTSKFKINFLNRLFKKKNSNQIYFSTSSSYVHLINFILGGYAQFVGYLGSFNKTFIDNKVKLIIEENRYNSLNIISSNLLNQKVKVDNFTFNQSKITHNIKKSLNLTPFIILNISKTIYWGDVTLPLETWATFLNNNEKIRKFAIFLVGDKSQINKNLKLKSLLSNLKILDLTNKTNFYELAFLIQKSQFIICNDTGVMHLANFFKKKNLSIFTFSDPKIYSNSRYSNIIFNKKYKCQPCISLSHDGNDNYPPVCFNDYNCSKTINSKMLENEFNNFLEANKNIS